MTLRLHLVDCTWPSVLLDRCGASGVTVEWILLVLFVIFSFVSLPYLLIGCDTPLVNSGLYLAAAGDRVCEAVLRLCESYLCCWLGCFLFSFTIFYVSHPLSTSLIAFTYNFSFTASQVFGGC